MQPEIKTKLTHLNHLLESAQNPKILLEEIQIVSQKAFTLQEELMLLLDESEKTETDIPTLQTVFNTREIVWDAIAQIATQEMAIKEKTYQKKTTSTPHQKKKDGCCSGESCCCDHHTCSEQKDEESHCHQGECSCQKKK